MDDVLGPYLIEASCKVICFFQFQQVSNACDLTPAWFQKGVEAALLAPTAINQQKFSFEYMGMKKNRHIVKANKGFSMVGYTHMDLGIAEYNFEVVAGNENFDWE